jgi:hypothetical protein
MVILLEPLWRFVLKETFVSAAETLMALITGSVSAIISPQTFLLLLASIPSLIGLGVSVFESRVGSNLYVVGAKPVYLPHRLDEVISFTRGLQEKQQKTGEKSGKNLGQFPEDTAPSDQDGMTLQ